MKIEGLDVELSKLHIESGDVVTITMAGDDNQVWEAVNEVGRVVKINHPDVDVMGIAHGIETKVLPPNERKLLAERLLGPTKTIKQGFYIERDDGEIQEGPFDTLALARTKLHAVYDEPEYRVTWIQPEAHFVQPS